MNDELYSAKYHQTIEWEETPMAERLAQYVKTIFSPASVLDFGCSTGTYVRALRECGVEATGLENSVAAVQNALSPWVLDADITDWESSKVFKADVGMCLEVAEHIPAEKADDLIRFLTDHSTRWLIFSAAVPGQGGVGHINCAEKPYWIEKFELRGWVVDYVQTQALLRFLSAGYHMGWMLNNGMVLRPIKAI